MINMKPRNFMKCQSRLIITVDHRSTEKNDNDRATFDPTDYFDLSDFYQIIKAPVMSLWLDRFKFILNGQKRSSLPTVTKTAFFPNAIKSFNTIGPDNVCLFDAIEVFLDKGP